jgi:hypothetical protein
MGDIDGLDDRVFSTVKRVVDHGSPQWWLHASRCSSCGQDWMVAQEERVHDNFYLKRLDPDEMRRLLERNEWPADFMAFEDVIRLGPDNQQVCQFLNTDDLTDTVKELMEAREDISSDEVAYLFCLSERDAERLMDRAAKTSWAKLRPFA